VGAFFLAGGLGAGPHFINIPISNRADSESERFLEEKISEIFRIYRKIVALSCFW